MADDFQVIYDKLAEVREEPGGAALQVAIQQLQAQSDAISSLMLMAQELSQPQPVFFTRG